MFIHHSKQISNHFTIKRWMVTRVFSSRSCEIQYLQSWREREYRSMFGSGIFNQQSIFSCLFIMQASLSMPLLFRIEICFKIWCVKQPMNDIDMRIKSYLQNGKRHTILPAKSRGTPQWWWFLKNCKIMVNLFIFSLIHSPISGQLCVTHTSELQVLFWLGWKGLPNKGKSIWRRLLPGSSTL